MNKEQKWPNEPEEVLAWLYDFNQKSEYGMTMPSSVAKRAVQHIRETRRERNLLFASCIVLIISLCAVILAYEL